MLNQKTHTITKKHLSSLGFRERSSSFSLKPGGARRASQPSSPVRQQLLARWPAVAPPRRNPKENH